MAWFDFVLGYLGNLITIIIDVTFDGTAKSEGRQTWLFGLCIYGSMVESVSFDVPEHRAALILQRSQLMAVKSRSDNLQQPV